MPGLNPTQEDIDQFIAITQASREDAEHFLVSGAGLQGAVEDFYAAQAAGDQSETDEDTQAGLESAIMSDQAGSSQQPNEGSSGSGGPRTLDGRLAEALPEGWGSEQKKPAKAAPSGGIKTLFNTGLHAENARNAPPEDDDDDDDDQGPSRQGQEFFTGGEKSGLAVQNPDQPGQRGARGIVDNILQQAARNGPNPLIQPGGSNSSRKSNQPFGGSGNTLGSEDTPSSVVSDESATSPRAPLARPSAGRAPAPGAGGGPSILPVSSNQFDDLLRSMIPGARGGRPAPPPPPPEEEETQTRHLTFWRDGFSIEDGPLMSYDDPQNKALLEAIQSGRAPPSVFNVRYNQPLQLEVAQRTHEDYRPPPKRPGKPFVGGGNRLGSPTPERSTGTSTPTMPGGFNESSTPRLSAAPPPAAAASAPPSFAVDSTKPTTNIQLRLGDGTKMVAKVNLTHTIGDLRSYVAAARPDGRNFVLQTTFPSKQLTDDSETIESAKLQNAVVVQRFT